MQFELSTYAMQLLAAQPGRSVRLQIGGESFVLNDLTQADMRKLYDLKCTTLVVPLSQEEEGKSPPAPVKKKTKTKK